VAAELVCLDQLTTTNLTVCAFFVAAELVLSHHPHVPHRVRMCLHTVFV
jgi:hypothetical protein